MHMFRGGTDTVCILLKEVFHVIDRNFQNNWNKYKRERSADVITYFARECNHHDVSCICQIIYSRFGWLQKDIVLFGNTGLKNSIGTNYTFIWHPTKHGICCLLQETQILTGVNQYTSNLCYTRHINILPPPHWQVSSWQSNKPGILNRNIRCRKAVISLYCFNMTLSYRHFFWTRSHIRFPSLNFFFQFCQMFE